MQVTHFCRFKLSTLVFVLLLIGSSTQSFGCGLFCLATNEIAQTGLSSLPPVIYYSEQLFSLIEKDLR